MRKRFNIIVLTILMVATAAACGSANADQVSSDCPAPEDVQVQQSEAQAELTDAQADAESATGTPAEDEAKTRVSEAQAQVDALNECSSATGATVQAPENCVDRYNVVFDENAGGKVIDEGLWASATAEEKLTYVIDKAQHDPRLLQLAWNSTPAGEKDPVNDWTAELTEGGCYSQKGRDLYQQTVGIYRASTVVLEEAPAEGINTGADVAGVHEIPGTIEGDRSGIKVTFPNGKEVWVMNRCGNFVTKGGIPGIPEKPVNPPPPETPPTSKPPTSWECQQNGGPNCPFPPVQQPPQDNDPDLVAPTPGAPTVEPPPAVRPPGDPDGGSGDGGAPAPTGPTDDTDSGEVTGPPPPNTDTCPLGPGNC